MQEEFELPETDDRLYRLFTLENHLEVLLIHDRGTEKAGAAMDVGVGSLCDTGSMPGIAHAVEHLLSMGTRKYPEVNAYDEYLSRYGGFSNAFTSPNSTNYYFELTYPPRTGDQGGRGNSVDTVLGRQSALPLWGALDRFCQMFISPIISGEVLAREMQAVDSEFKESRQDDARRIYQLNKSLANPKHPYSRFSFGNWKTLHDDPIARGLVPREECMDFFSTQYASNRMKLVILGREALDVLENLVREMFSAIPQRVVARRSWPVALYTKNELSTQTFVKPLQQLYSLQMQFMYPDEEALFESHPSWYLIHLLSHKGPGSIYAILRAKGWANDVEAGCFTVCPGSGLFRIDVEMTRAGATKYREVVVLVFQYIAMLQREPPQEWVVEEMMHLSEIEFRFRAKSAPSHTVSTLASALQNPYRGSKLMSGPATIQTFNPNLIRHAMTLLRPDNFRLTVVNPNEDTLGWDRSEPWYGTKYRTERIPAEFLAAIERPFYDPKIPADLHFAHKNRFIHSQLGMESPSPDQSTATPVLLTKNDLVRTWWKSNGQFREPKATVHIYFRTPLLGVNMRNELVASLFTHLVEDALVVPLHDAINAGLRYDVSCHSGGVELTINGYGSALQTVLENILRQMTDPVVEGDRFAIVHDRMMNSIRNWDHEQPWEQITSYSDYFRSEKSFAFEDLPQALETVTLEEVEAFCPRLFEQCQIELFAHGNVSRKDALSLSALVKQSVMRHSLGQARFHAAKSVVLPPGCDIVYEKKLLTSENVNNCIEYSLYAGSCCDRGLRAKLYLLAQLIEEPCFHHLRTTEQLGYVVRSGHVFLEAWAGFAIVLQSEQSCKDLESHINAFLHTFEHTLLGMSTESFTSHKDALRGTLVAKYTNFHEADARIWSHMSSDSYDFMQGEQSFS
jgi:insulysin